MPNINYGQLSVAVPSGLACSAAFGTPTIIRELSANGYVASAAFGALTLATPAGYGATTVAGSAGAAIPIGYAASVAAGSVGAAIPSGYAPSIAFGAYNLSAQTSIFPKYIGAGQGSILTGPGFFLPTYPTGGNAGDRYFLQIAHRNNTNGLAATLSYAVDWTIVNVDTNASARQWVLTRPATGAETLTFTVEVIGGGLFTCAAMCHLVMSVTSANMIENGTLVTGVGTNRTDAAVTSSADYCLAMNFLFCNNIDAPIEPFAGATGGSWFVGGTLTTAIDPRLGVEYASLTTAGTVIDGGANSPPITSGLWINRGFAVRGIDAAAALTLSPTGYSASTAAGRVPLVVPIGLADNAVKSGAALAIPSGYSAGNVFGAPTITAALLPAGYAATFVAGNTPVVVPFGLAASAAKSAAPVAVPSGYAASAGFGGASIAIPSGKSIGATVGSTSVAVPAGASDACIVGSVPLAIPAGASGTSAFGTPTLQIGNLALTIAPTGYAAAAAFGGLPLVAPSGAGKSLVFSAPTISVAPRGLSARDGASDFAKYMQGLIAEADSKHAKITEAIARERRTQARLRQRGTSPYAPNMRASFARVEALEQKLVAISLETEIMRAERQRAEHLAALRIGLSGLVREAEAYAKRASLDLEAANTAIDEWLRADDEEAILALL